MEATRLFVIVGSRELRAVPARVLSYITRLDGENIVGLRSPLEDPAQPFEALVAQVCAVLGIEVRWFRPDPKSGRSGVYHRDIKMVREADCVLAFFAGDQMKGGTEHVVEKALDDQIPVYSFGIQDGRWIMLGSNDPYDIWSRFAI